MIPQARIAFVSFALFAGLIVSQLSKGNEMLERPLAERISLADIIIVGSISCNSNSSQLTKSLAYLPIRVESIIKGKPETIVLLLVQDPIVENSPDCCIDGKSYLMFLKRLGDNRYVSVNGRFGIYEFGESESH